MRRDGVVEAVVLNPRRKLRVAGAFSTTRIDALTDGGGMLALGMTRSFSSIKYVVFFPSKRVITLFSD
jgi:hypothetical protein